MLTYGGTEVQDVTYNGNAVSSITYNGVEVWTAVKPNLNDNDWDKIAKVCADGKAANYWNVGDSKELVLNGIIKHGSTDRHTFTNTKYKATILGFNHNATKEGNNRTHFIIGKNESDTDVAIVGASNLTWIISANSEHACNWTDSTLKYSLDSNHEMYTPSNRSFVTAMPTALKNSLKTVTKYVYRNTTTTRGGGSLQSYSSTIDIPSEMEIFGKRTYSHSLEADACQQYDYYKNGASKIRKSDKDGTTAVQWYLRSPDSSFTLSSPSSGSNWAYNTQPKYCYVSAAGAAGSCYAWNELAITPIFFL